MTTGWPSVSIDDLVRDEGVIMLDTSVAVHTLGGRWYERMVYETTNFAELDTGIMRAVAREMELYADLLSQQNTKTIAEVAEALERLHGILTDKIRTLTIFESRGARPSRQYVSHHDRTRQRHHNTYDDDDAEEPEPNKEILQDIAWSYERAARSARRSILSIDDAEFYNALERTLAEIAQRDVFVSQSREEKPRDRTGAPSITIKMTTAALCMSLMKSQSTTILTRDSAFGRLVAFSEYFLTQPHVGRHQEYAHQLHEFPVKAYFRDEFDTAALMVDTSIPGFLATIKSSSPDLSGLSERLAGIQPPIISEIPKPDYGPTKS